MVPITRQYKQTAPMTNAVWARNHTVNAAMKPAKKVATAHVGFDRADPSSPAPATPSVKANTLRPIAALGIGPKTLALMTSNHLPGGLDLPGLSRSLFSDYVVAFEVTSVLLVVAVVGTVVLARRPGKRGPIADRDELASLGDGTVTP